MKNKEISILIVDSDKERNNRLFRAFKSVLEDLKSSYSSLKYKLFVCFKSIDNKQNLLFHSGEDSWSTKPSNVEGPRFVTILFQHGSDAIHIPAKLSIKYSGRSSGAIGTDNEYGIKTAVNFNNIPTVFSYESKPGGLDHLKDIVKFSIERNEIPSLLNYSSSLESRLNEFYQSFTFRKNDSLKGKISSILKIKSPLKVIIFWDTPTFFSSEKIKPSSLEYLIQIDPIVGKLRRSENTISIIDNHIEIISSEEKFWNLIKTQEISNFDVLIINSEKPHANKTLSNFLGINYLAIIRNFGFKGIAFLLTANLEAILKRWNEFPILKANYSFIYDLSKRDIRSSVINKQEEDWERILSYQKLKMSSRYLEDVKKHLINKFGQLHEIHHFYKGQIMKIENTIGFIDDTFKTIKILIPDKKHSKLNDICERIKENFVLKGSKESARTAFKSEYDEIKKLIPKKQELNDEKLLQRKRNWKVLLLEDSLEDAKKIVEFLKENGLNVLHCTNVLDAESEIEFDVSNEIRVAIADIRLTDENGRWQIFQGYDFINYVYNSNHFLSIIAITNKKGLILSNAEKQGKVFYRWFSKEKLYDATGKNEFLNLIISLGDEVPFIPSLDIWHEKKDNFHEYPLKVYYKKYRIDGNYQLWEDEIHRATTVIWKTVKQKIQKKKDVSINKLIIENLPSNLQALMKSKELKNDLVHFKNLLKARRILIALADIKVINSKGEERYFSLGSLYEFLRGKESKVRSVDKKFFTQYLGISSNLDNVVDKRKVLLEERGFIRDVLINLER